MTASCLFHVRRPVDGGFSYETLRPRSPSASGHLPLEHPPVVGDLVWLSSGGAGATYRVVERSWTWPMFMSTDWPSGEMRPIGLPLLDLIVELDEGPFRDEVETGDEDDG